MLFPTTAAATYAISWWLCSGQTVSYFKLICRESYCSEECAGVIVIGCICTFLIRYTVIGRLNKKLGVALNSDYREETEGDEESRTCGICYKLVTQAITYSLGEIGILCATARTGTVAIRYSCAENNRLYSLYNGYRITVRDRVEISYVAEGVFGTGCECDGVAVATVKDYILFKSSYTREYLTVSYSKTRFCFNLDVTAHNY